MKYISRITALLLVLMMLTPTFASALTLGTATQGDLDRLYQEATDSGYEYYPTGYLGFWGEVDAFDTLTNKDAYTFQWYDAEGNALQSYGEDAPEKLRFVYTMETQYFHCVATRVSDGATMTSAIKVIPPADISNPEDYLGFLYDPSIFLDVFGAADTLTIYHMMIDTWNVTMPNGMNLAESILELWWSEREESYFDPYLLCSCVVSGAVASDECVLHPNSDLHVNGCSWKQPEISANVDVSTPESLLMLENVVLAAGERPDVDAYAWQNYVYDPAIAGMRWAVVEYVQGTNLYTIQINKESIQTAYRVVIETTDYNVFESKPLYLGGYDFFNWILTTDGIQEWMADESVTLADVVARYNTAADEEDRTNAEDYTYGEEGESVNLKVPQGTFAEDYVMEFAEIAAGRVEQLQNVVMAQMDATGTHVAQVLMALDISFASLANRAKKLQPNAPVTLTFQVDTTGLDEALKYLYVYHIANDGTPEVVAGPVEVTFGVQPIPVQAEGFSTYLAMATSDVCVYCQQHEYCFYDELLINYKTPAEQYAYLVNLADDDFTGYLSDYVRHIEAGAPAILCTCVNYNEIAKKDDLKSHEEEHPESCPWADKTENLIGLVGFSIDLAVSVEGTYEWYLEHEDGTRTELGNQSNTYEAEYEKEPKLYICEVTTADGTTEYRYYVQADMTDVYQYLGYLEGLWVGDERDRHAIYELMTTTWNVPLDETEGNTLAKAILVYWKYNYIEDYIFEDVLCSCCINDDGVVTDQIMLHPDAAHTASECPWRQHELGLNPVYTDNGTLYYELMLIDENEELVTVAVSAMLDEQYHYFQDVNTGWYVAYLHEVTNEDGTVTQWIIPLPSEEDLEETPAN